MRHFFTLALVTAFMTANVGYAQVNYQLDDGVAETAIGLGGTAGTFLWGNSFSVAPGGEVLTEFQAGFGGATAGLAIDWAIFSDTDADPTTGMTLLANGTHTVVNEDFVANGTLDTINIGGGLNVSGGSDFFISLGTDAGGFPATIDNTPGGQQLQSWTAFAVGGVLDVANSADWGGALLIDDVGTNTALDGNWIIRATGIAKVPEPSTAAIVGLLGITGLARRRRG